MGSQIQPATSRLHFSRALLQRLSHARLDRFTHARKRQEIQRLLDRIPILGRQEDGTTAPADNHHWPMRLVGLVDESVQVGARFASRDRVCHGCSPMAEIVRYSYAS